MSEGRTPTAERMAIEWLLRVEALTDPAVQDLLVTSIADCSPFIRRVEFGIDRQGRSILVFVEVPPMVRRLLGIPLASRVEDQVRALLPSFRIQTTFEHSDIIKFVDAAS